MVPHEEEVTSGGGLPKYSVAKANFITNYFITEEALRNHD